MSIRRWCVRISNWSRLVLLTCGERRCRKRFMRVGRERGPDHGAGALGGVDDLGCRTGRSTCNQRPSGGCGFCFLVRSPFSILRSTARSDDLGHDARADGAATFADGEAQAFFHGDQGRSASA